MDPRKRLNEEPEGALNFEKDERAARIGDPMPKHELRKKLPKRREREAGLTGASTGHATADDAAPETLLDEGQPHAIDKELSTVDESTIGEGRGKDEAELAEEEPVGRPKRPRDQAASGRGPGRMHSRNAAARRAAEQQPDPHRGH